MEFAAHLAALLAVMATAVVYGTDVFCALVQRPALVRVDDATLTSVMGKCIASAADAWRSLGSSA